MVGRVVVGWMAVSMAVALLACERTSTRPDAPLATWCAHASSQERWSFAAPSCDAAWQLSGDVASANRAMVAYWRLDQDARALALGEALRDQPADGDRASVEGYILQKAGRDAEAERAFATALAAYRHAGAHADAAQAAGLLFSYARAAGRYGDALEQAQILLDESASLDPAFRCAGLMKAAAVLIDVGDLRDAEQLLAEARRLTTPDLAATLATLDTDDGLVHKQAGRLDVAQSYYASALRRVDATTQRKLAWEIQVNVASLALDRDDAAGAHAALAGLDALNAPGQAPPSVHAPALVRMLRGQLAHLEGRLDAAVVDLEAAWAMDDLTDQRLQIDTTLGEIEIARGHRDAATRYLRRALAEIDELRRSTPFDGLVGWLARARRRPAQLLVDVLAQAGDGDALVELVESQQPWAFVREAPAGVDAGAAPLARAISRTRALERLTTQLRGHAQARLPARELATRLAGAGIVMYAEGATRLWIISLQGSRWVVDACPLALPELRRLVDALASDPAQPAAATALAAALLPARRLPAPPTPLVVVPSALLAELPFAALRRHGRFVVEDHPLAQVPDLDALVAMHALVPAGASSRLWLGDPEGDLPGAALEVAELSRLHGGRAFVGAAATRAQLPGQRAWQVLQFSAHSSIDAQGPYVQLADGKLRAADVLELDLRGDLVVLASCASASPVGNLPWSSLAAAFLATRSRAVLGTLHVVEDEPTRRFVRAFYEQGGATAPVAALAAAQRQAIRRGDPVSAWGWFVMYGVGELR